MSTNDLSFGPGIPTETTVACRLSGGGLLTVEDDDGPAEFANAGLAPIDAAVVSARLRRVADLIDDAAAARAANPRNGFPL